MEKLYFSEFNDEMCHTKDYLMDEMKEQSLTELKVFEAIRETGVDYFYCRAIGEPLMRGKAFEPCGNTCDDYDPRNGKSGCCKHRGYCYEPGKEFTLNIKGILS